MHGTQGFDPGLSIIWPQPDQMLIESVAGGDKKALEELFARHSARIYRFVLRITGNAALSEELLMSAHLAQLRFVHDQDAVGALNCRKTVGNDQRCAV